MITGQDDLIGHQHPTGFSQLGNSDPSWMERLYYAGYRISDGGMLLTCGIGYHPNRDVMDGFVGISKGTRQHTLRFSRYLSHNPLDVEIGPFRIDVLEGLRRHRLRLAPNDLGLTLDVEFSSNLHPHVEHPRQVRRGNRIVEDTIRYQQAGRMSGWIKLDGEETIVDPAQWYAQRDHSWGIRGAFRTDADNPPVSRFRGLLFAWGIGQFEDRAIHLYLMDKGPGEEIYLSGEEVLRQSKKVSRRRRIRVARHAFEWDTAALGQQMISATFDLVLADGTEKRLVIRPTGTRFFLKAGLYGGLAGWDHGDDKGPYYQEHQIWDLTDPADRQTARALSDEICTFEDDLGTGYGSFQYWVTEGYPIYPEAQAFPAP